MFQELLWSPVPNRINYNKAVLTYRALINLTPAYITNVLKPMPQVHSLNLRSSEKDSLYVPKSRTALYSDLFSCSAPRLWNVLPQCARETGSLDSFKKTLKNNLKIFTHLNQQQCNVYMSFICMHKAKPSIYNVPVLQTVCCLYPHQAPCSTEHSILHGSSRYGYSIRPTIADC